MKGLKRISPIRVLPDFEYSIIAIILVGVILFDTSVSLFVIYENFFGDLSWAENPIKIVIHSYAALCVNICLYTTYLLIRYRNLIEMCLKRDDITYIEMFFIKHVWFRYLLAFISLLGGCGFIYLRFDNSLLDYVILCMIMIVPPILIRDINKATTATIWEDKQLK